MPTLDETGLEVGGCRHAIAQKAVNMFCGEMYVFIIYVCYYLNLPLFAAMVMLITYILKYLLPKMLSTFGRT